MNPLAIFATGMYGKPLTASNGAPFRLVVPWKYGFKSIKSIVKIDLVEEMPVSTWMDAEPNEYGFYANVNPNVDHPRWSQATERRVGELDRRRHVDVQRLRRRGRLSVRGHGPGGEFLMDAFVQWLTKALAMARREYRRGAASAVDGVGFSARQSD